MVVLSTIFPGPMTSSFLVTTVAVTDFNSAPEFITVTDTETDADFNYFGLDLREKLKGNNGRAKSFRHFFTLFDTFSHVSEFFPQDFS